MLLQLPVYHMQHICCVQEFINRTRNFVSNENITVSQTEDGRNNSTNLFFGVSFGCKECTEHLDFTFQWILLQLGTHANFGDTFMSKCKEVCGFLAGIYH